jgi:hypothetical protein
MPAETLEAPPYSPACCRDSRIQIKLRPVGDSLGASCAMACAQGLEAAAWLGLDVSVGRSLKGLHSGSTRLSNQMATL